MILQMAFCEDSVGSRASRCHEGRQAWVCEQPLRHLALSRLPRCYFAGMLHCTNAQQRHYSIPPLYRLAPSLSRACRTEEALNPKPKP